MARVEREVAPGVEEASRELRLIEQSFFRDILKMSAGGIGGC